PWLDGVHWLLLCANDGRSRPLAFEFRQTLLVPLRERHGELPSGLRLDRKVLPCASSPIARPVSGAQVLPNVESSVSSGHDVVGDQWILERGRLAADPAQELL